MSQPIRILIVDDDKATRKIVKEILCGGPDSVFQCVAVHSFRECLEVCEAKATDYIILDLELPDRLGFEGLKDLNELYPNMPTIIFTGHHSQADAVRAMNEYGVLAYITKPITDINAFYKSITDAIVRHNNEKKVDSKIGKKDLKMWAGVGSAILTLLTAAFVFGEKVLDLLRAIFWR
jgi:DNA-binding NtrC family response regulator